MTTLLRKPTKPSTDLGSGRKLLATAALIAAAQLAGAQSTDEYGVHEKHIERLTEAQKVAPVGVDGFGDQISYFTGSLAFNNVDISLPGNSGLPVELRRKLAIEDRRELNDGPSPKGHLGGFAEWSLDIPHLSGLFKATVGWQVAGSAPTQRCSSTYAPAEQYPFGSQDYWNGYNLSLPGGGSEPLLVASASSKLPAAPGQVATHPWITRSLWRFSCMPGTFNNYGGEGFLGVAPDGTKYHFDYVITRAAPTLKYGGFPATVPTYDYMVRETVYFLVSKVEDRFGNYVTYSYSGDKLTQIKGFDKLGQADGREINLGWSGDKVQTATAPTGTWTYGYTGNSLSTVTRPDNSQWAYARTGKLFVRMPPPAEPEDDEIANCPEGDSPLGDPVVYAVTHPAGATASFTLSPQRHYRSNVPHICVKPSTTYEYLQVPNFTDNYTLLSKSITGPGLTTMSWTYQYNGGHGLAFASNCGTVGGPLCPDVRKVTISGTAPINTWEEHEYGILYDINEGQLLKRRVGSSPSNVLQTTTNTYVSNAEVAGKPFPDLVGQNPLLFADQLANRMRPLKSRVINQQGVNFSRTTTTFDEFGNSLSDSVSGTASRTEATEYQHDLARWIVMLPKRRLINGTEVDKTDYDSASMLPWRTHRFGLLMRTFTYDVYGSLSTVKEGTTNQTTTLSEWKWGIPQSVQFAIANQSIEATVDNRGWVTQVTDEMDNTTTYGYDAMGRVESITYPAGNIPSWASTAVTFAPNAGDPYSIGAGHWKRTETRGAYRKETFYDALWRPVVEKELDTGATGTQRVRAWEYDHQGRTTFAAYPRASANSVADFNGEGVHTGFDAIGRTVSILQTTELSTPAVTAIQYLNNFTTKKTNPRGIITETQFHAYDRPTVDAPKLIEEAEWLPEKRTTEITRNAFGLTTRIVRSGVYSTDYPTWGNPGNQGPVAAVRTYEYDSHMRLCKRNEPETGSTLYDYDGAQNIAWMAVGLSQLNPVCDRQNVAAADRITYTYDARNRRTAVNYPDSTADLTVSYNADGSEASIVSGTVASYYTYNNRGMVTAEQLLHGAVNWTTQHTYSALGDLAATTYPDGHVVDFQPNALGQQTKAGTYASSATYHPNGMLQGFTYGNQVAHSRTLNARQLPDTILETKGSTQILNDAYDYDFNGNVAAISDGIAPHVGDRTMTYDPLDRLIHVQTGAEQGGSDTFVYDPLDNLRIRDNTDDGSWIEYGYSDRNLPSGFNDMFTVSAGTGIKYRPGPKHDPRGNMTNRGYPYSTAEVLTYDLANRLISTSSPMTYSYDGLGRRVRSVEGFSGTKNFYYSKSGQLLYSQRVNNGELLNYVYLDGRLVATRQVGGSSPGVTYAHTDLLGSPVAETNTSGTVTRRERFKAYGEPADGTVNTRLGFTGHYSDNNDLVYMQQRYYHPALGRFMSADPMEADTQNAWNFNRYNYAANNPYRNKDPDGRACDSLSGGGCGMSTTGESTADEESAREGREILGDAAIAVGADLLLGGPSGESVAIFGALRTARVMQRASKIERSVKVDKIGKFTRTTETRPGKGPGQSRAEYVRIKNADGKTVKTYKDSYDRAGKHQGRKPLRGGPEGRPQSDPPPPKP